MDTVARIGLEGSAREAAARARPIMPVAHADSPAAVDAALVTAAQQGDREAFARLITRHQQLIYGYLQARLLEPADAEDLCQEVFLRCYRGREKLGRALAVESWLIGIAKNVLREHVRLRSRRREVAWTELCLELDALIANHPTIEHDALVHLSACLAGLGPSAREAIDLRYQAKRSMEEISRQLGRSEGAVRLLVHRARQALRHCLEQKLGLQQKLGREKPGT